MAVVLEIREREDDPAEIRRMIERLQRDVDKLIYFVAELIIRAELHHMSTKPVPDGNKEG